MAKSNRRPPVDNVQGSGIIVIGMTAELTHVVMQFTDPDWWVHLTPEEARNVGHQLIVKANELEADQRAFYTN
jgi:hypothetical protein